MATNSRSSAYVDRSSDSHLLYYLAPDSSVYGILSGHWAYLGRSEKNIKFSVSMTHYWEIISNVLAKR